jgi:hypothetical protein
VVSSTRGVGFVVALVLAFGMCAPFGAEAKLLLGDPFPIAEDGSSQADVAYDASSDRYLAAWADLGQGVDARLLDGSAKPLGPAFRISNGSSAVVVVSGPAGEFFVMWRECAPGALEGCNLVGQRLRPTGAALAGPFVIAENTGRGGTAVYNPKRREYLVAWATDEVRAQRLAADGSRVGTQAFVVSAKATIGPPVLAHNSVRDEYLVAWDQREGDYFDDLRGQRLDASGQQVGADDFAIPASDAGSPGGGGAFTRAFAEEVAHDPVHDRYLLFRQFVSGGSSTITSRWISGSGALGGTGPAALGRGTGSNLLGAPSASFDVAESRFYWVWTEDLDDSLDLNREIFASPLDGEAQVSNFGIDNTPPWGRRREAYAGTIAYNRKADEHLAVFTGGLTRGGSTGVFARRIGNPPDHRAPTVTVSARRRQRVVRRRGVVIRVRCDEPCGFLASARISLPGASKSMGLVRKRGSLIAGKSARVKLRLSRSKVRSLRRALRRRDSVRVRVTVTAKDRALNTSTVRRSIRATR